MCHRNTSTLMCLMEGHSWAKRAVLSLQRHGVAVPWVIFSNMDQPHLYRLVYFNLVLYSRAYKNKQKMFAQYSEKSTSSWLTINYIISTSACAAVLFIKVPFVGSNLYGELKG